MPRLARQRWLGCCKTRVRKQPEMRDVAITHGAALNALDRVSVLMAANVFVITATNKLISQKLSTMRQVMKKKQDMKNSESITLYINDDHWESYL
jgi:tellurite resistance protein